VSGRVKRVYEPAAPVDGVRVLVDRLWPRGLSKEAAQVVVGRYAQDYHLRGGSPGAGSSSRSRA
jgi:uncharacterized protein YeaO (DUF488 family)